MKFCWHCWHPVLETFNTIMKESFCKIKKIEVDYYEWDSKCCRCGEIKKDGILMLLAGDYLKKNGIRI